MPRGSTNWVVVVVVVRRVMMMMMMRIQFTILVEHLTWPPGPSDRRFPGSRPIGLSAPWKHLVLLACFPGCLSLILVAHGWGVIQLQFSEHAPLSSKKTVLIAQPGRDRDKIHKRYLEMYKFTFMLNRSLLRLDVECQYFNSTVS